MPVTIFLVVLIVALAVGNILLSLMKPAPAAQQALAEQQTTLALEEQPQEKTQSVFKADPALKQAAERERVNMLNKRIDRLESLLLKINGAKFLGKKLNSTVLGQKLNGFNEFKDTTKLEIAALKQDLARVKKEVGMKEKPKQEDYPISNDKLHELVFRPGEGKS